MLKRTMICVFLASLATTRALAQGGEWRARQPPASPPAVPHVIADSAALGVIYLRPDLRVVRVDADYPGIQFGARTIWPVRVIVWNAGRAAAGPFTVTLYTPNAEAVSTGRVERLVPGSEIAIGMFATWNTTVCENTFTVTADSGRNVRESNEANNSMTGGRIC